MKARIALSSHMLSARPVHEAIEIVARDFKAWEIVGEGGHCLPDIEKELKALLPSYDLECSVHTPLSDVNIASMNPRMLEAAMKEVLDAIECTGRLGFGPFTLHPGFYSPLGMVNNKAVQEQCRRSVQAIDRAAKENGVLVALENMPDMPISMITTPEELLSYIEGTEIKVCFDFGHANTTHNIERFLGLKDRIVNVHIHDNLGKFDQHLPIGDGNIEFRRLLPMLDGYKGRYVIEARDYRQGPVSKARLEQLLG